MLGYVAKRNGRCQSAGFNREMVPDYPHWLKVTTRASNLEEESRKERDVRTSLAFTG